MVKRMLKTEITENLLRDLYEKQQIPIYKIADICECSVKYISDKLKELNIVIRNSTSAKVVIDKEILTKLYYTDKLGIERIAKQFNCSYSVIRRLFKEYNIIVWDTSDARIVYP